MRSRYPKRVSQKAVRNALQGLSALAKGTTPEFEAPSPRQRKRGKQPESYVGEANRKAARLLGGVLYRNRRGLLPLPGGGMLPVGLGPNGFPDSVGYLPVTITADMIGRKVGVFWACEDKTDAGVVAEHQLQCIEELRDAGCIAGVARNVDELHQMVERWRRG